MHRFRWTPQTYLAFVLMSISCGPGDPLEEARRLQAEGRYEETVEPLGELVQTRRDDPEAHYLYGLALLRAGRFSQAVWPLRRAMESLEWLVTAGLQLAAGELQTGNQDEAVEVVTRVLEQEPDNTAALLLRATARNATRRDYEGALADTDRLLEIEPESERVLPQRAIALLGLRRSEEAEEALALLERSATDGVVPGPTAGGYCGARAKFAEESGEVEEAERLYRSCLEQFPTNALLVMEAIAFFDAIGKPEDATAALRDAHEAMPQARDPRVNLAVRLERLGDVEAAEALLRDATRDAQTAVAAHAYADLGGFLSQHGRYPEAIESYERAVELAPEARERLLFAYADTLIRAQEPDRALTLADEIKTPAERHLIRGRALLEKGEPRAALDELERGLELWPNQPIGRFYAGLAAEQLGDFDRAIEEYRYAIRADAPLDARVRLARLHRALNQPRRALSALRHDPTGTGLPVEAALLELELAAAISGEISSLRPVLNRPELRGRMVAALAAGTRRRAGRAAAARVVLEASRLDLADPASAPAISSLAEDLWAIAETAQALELLDRVREKATESAALVALHAEALERADRAPEARARYERALALEPDQARALRGRARLAAAAGDLEAALRDYERASEAAEAAGLDDSRALLAAADILESQSRSEEAAGRLEAWLARHPLDGEVALRLASLLAAREDGAQTARGAAKRAVRLGAGPEAIALAEQLEVKTATP